MGIFDSFSRRKKSEQVEQEYNELHDGEKSTSKEEEADFLAWLQKEGNEEAATDPERNVLDRRIAEASEEIQSISADVSDALERISSMQDSIYAKGNQQYDVPAEGMDDEGMLGADDDEMEMPLSIEDMDDEKLLSLTQMLDMSEEERERLLGDESLLMRESVYQTNPEDDIVPTDELRRELGIKEQHAKLAGIQEKVSRIPTKLLFAIAGILLLLVIVAGVFLFIQVQKKNALEKQRAPGTTNVKKVSMTANDANYIFVNQSRKRGEDTLTLTKLLLSPVASQFYFETNLDLRQFDISLVDDQNRAYEMDVSYQQVPVDPNEERILHFAPLRQDVKWITLNVFDRVTKQPVSFEIRFEKPIEQTPVRYLTEAVAAQTNADDYQITVTNALFSSTGSNIHYAITWDDDKVGIMHGVSSSDMNDYILLYEGASLVAAQKPAPTMVRFGERIIVGSMPFDRVRHLNGSLTVLFKDLYQCIHVGTEFSPVSLFDYKAEGHEIVMDLEPYQVVFEGMKKFDSQYVLTYHIENEAVFAKNEATGTQDNRVEGIVNAKLLVGTPSGMQIEMDGACMAGQQGGDIIFDASAVDQLLKGVTIQDYTIAVSDVAIKMEDVSVKIDLDRDTSGEPQKDNALIQDMIRTAFLERLALKQGVGSISALQKSFTDEILKSPIMQDYEINLNISDGMPSVQIQALFVSGDMAYAKVSESLFDNKGTVLFYRGHQIVLRRENGAWTVVSDVINK